MAFDLEKAKEFGFKLVHEAEGLVRFENVSGGAVRVVESASVDEALATIEHQVNAFPGASGDVSARSDGVHESLDKLQEASGQVGPTPAADAAAAPAPAPEPAPEAAPEGVVES